MDWESNKHMVTYHLSLITGLEKLHNFFELQLANYKAGIKNFSYLNIYLTQSFLRRNTSHPTMVYNFNLSPKQFVSRITKRPWENIHPTFSPRKQTQRVCTEMENLCHKQNKRQRHDSQVTDPSVGECRFLHKANSVPS